MYFTKMNKIADHHLGKCCRGGWGGLISLFFSFYSNTTFSVEEIRYEKVLPQLDTATLNEATELKFTVQPNTDYFTR